MSFHLEAALSVPLCLLLLFGALIQAPKLEEEHRRQTRDLAATLPPRLRTTELYARRVSPEHVPYQLASGQKSVEFISLILDSKNSIQARLPHAEN